MLCKRGIFGIRLEYIYYAVNFLVFILALMVKHNVYYINNLRRVKHETI